MLICNIYICTFRIAYRCGEEYMKFEQDPCKGFQCVIASWCSKVNSIPDLRKRLMNMINLNMCLLLPALYGVEIV